MPLFRHLYDLKDVFRAPSGLFLALGPLSGVLVTRWNLDSLTIFSIFHIDSKKTERGADRRRRIYPFAVRAIGRNVVYPSIPAALTFVIRVRPVSGNVDLWRRIPRFKIWVFSRFEHCSSSLGCCKLLWRFRGM